jgi:hypothetical protein
MHTVVLLKKALPVPCGVLKKNSIVLIQKLPTCLHVVYLSQKPALPKDCQMNIQELRNMKQLLYKIENLEHYSTYELVKMLECCSEQEFVKCCLNIVNNKLKRMRNQCAQEHVWRPARYMAYTYDYAQISSDRKKINEAIIHRALSHRS